MPDETTAKGYISGRSTWTGAGESSVSHGLMVTPENTDANEIISLEDSSENMEHHGIVNYVEERFERAKTARYSDEHRWLLAYKNYRGLSDNHDVQTTFTKTEKSKVFIKVTKVKVNAAYAQICDVIFAGNKFPIGAEASPVPEGIAESVHFDPQDQSAQQGKEQGSIPVARQDILEKLGPFKESLSRVKDKLKEGPGLTPTAHTWEPAKEAAKKLNKKFQDMFEESNAQKHLHRTLYDLCEFGTGVFKGPMARKKEYPKWDSNGDYIPSEKIIADYSHVSIWDTYPDPEAKIAEELQFLVERHKMNRSMLRDLKKRPYFREEAIDKAIQAGPNYIKEYWENTLEDNSTEVTPETYQVLEFWGIVDKEIAKDNNIEIPKEYEDFDEVQVNIWVCNGYPIRVVFNPFKPARIPYFLVPYEINPYSIFGIGVAENMEDTQMLMNGFMRMAVDNAALSNNNIFEVNQTMLAAGQDMEIYPGKIFYTEGAPGQAIRDYKIQNVTNENFMMFDKARQLADEATGIPSYSHGQSGIQSVGRTAAGMSMLMGASALNIKNVIRNLDEYLFVLLGRATYSYLMQFEFDQDFIGDLEIVARGTQSLMRNEVRSGKILQALQVTGNPMDAPFTKRPYLLAELMDSLDIDPAKSINDLREAGIQAEIMKEMQLKMGIDPNTQQPGGNPAGVPQPTDPTGNGGGNIAPGAAPVPGAPGYSGGGGGDNGGNTQNRPGQPV